MANAARTRIRRRRQLGRTTADAQTRTVRENPVRREGMVRTAFQRFRASLFQAAIVFPGSFQNRTATALRGPVRTLRPDFVTLLFFQSHAAGIHSALVVWKMFCCVRCTHKHTHTEREREHTQRRRRRRSNQKYGSSIENDGESLSQNNATRQDTKPLSPSLAVLLQK